MIFLGIDPGLSGAIAAITSDGIEFHDMPVLAIKAKQQLDYAGLSHILRQYSASGDVDGLHSSSCKKFQILEFFTHP